MGARQANLSVYRASACGIPASKLLFVLDRDRAYIHPDSCTSANNYTTLRTQSLHVFIKEGLLLQTCLMVVIGKQSSAIELRHGNIGIIMNHSVDHLFCGAVVQAVNLSCVFIDIFEFGPLLGMQN